MQIFELHFNPKLREEQTFDTFVYEPENIYEKKLGSLYMAGELQNTLPQNLKFLDNLAGVIKKNFYTLSAKNPENALSHCLKEVNEYLDKEIKKDNVSWLGNLNFAVLVLSNSNLIFTKTGELKILLLRAGKITDIGKQLDLREIEPYPVKVFLNIASGKLAENDIILVLTKEVFNFLQQENLLNKIAEKEIIDAKSIKEILPSSLFIKGEGSKISGLCLLIQVKPENKRTRLLQGLSKQRRKLKILSKINPIKFTHPLTTKLLNKARLPNFPKLPKPRKFQLTDTLRKKLVLILIFIFLLILGFLLF